MGFPSNVFEMESSCIVIVFYKHVSRFQEMFEEQLQEVVDEIAEQQVGQSALVVLMWVDEVCFFIFMYFFPPLLQARGKHAFALTLNHSDENLKEMNLSLRRIKMKSDKSPPLQDMVNIMERLFARYQSYINLKKLRFSGKST